MHRSCERNFTHMENSKCMKWLESEKFANDFFFTQNKQKTRLNYAFRSRSTFYGEYAPNEQNKNEPKRDGMCPVNIKRKKTEN